MSFTPLTLGRLYLVLQGVLGALWWVGAFALPDVRRATLGSLPLEVAWADVPLFVGASLLAAAGLRWAAWAALGWTFFVTAGLAAYATVTREAGAGLILMGAASGGTALAAGLVLLGRVPTEWLIQGPFTFRPSPDARGHLARTLRQLVAFWTVFLLVLPFCVVVLERRWRLDAVFPLWLRASGLILFLLASALGVASAVTMARLGEGTPLPIAMAKRLVVAGPYRWVRNPMAVAGIGQGAAVGLMASSWLVVAYAVAGSLVWNWAIRPHEEADLATRFGEEFEDYRKRVSCWIPRALNP